MTGPSENAAEDKDATMIAVGSRLAGLRAAKEMTQAEFAAEIGMTARAYHYYERGTRGIPPDRLATISRVFSVDLNWLLCGSGTSEVVDHSEELHQFIISLQQYLATTGTQLQPVAFGNIVSRWFRSFCEGQKIAMSDVHLWIDLLKVVPQK